MYEFDKIIFSRKGYDSSNGGDYSRYDSDGKFIVLPIPVREEEAGIGNKLRFDQIQLKPGYLLKHDASNVKQLINQLVGTMISKTKTKKAERSDYAHFDPMLGPCCWLDGESKTNIGAFGQRGTSQSHLINKCVNKNSLFLFFSRFKPLQNGKGNLDFNIDPSKGAYFLYGWLKVYRVAREYSEIQDAEIEKKHPHATLAYYQDPAHQKKQ